jgi:MFS family permease
MLLTGTPARLIAMTGLTNLAYWLLWPAAIVRVAGLGWGPGLSGLFGSAAPLAMFVALPIAQRLATRRGPKNVVVIAIGALSASALGSALLPGGALEWVWTALLGFGTGLRWIAADSWIADAVPPHRSGRVLSLGETVVG